MRNMIKDVKLWELNVKMENIGEYDDFLHEDVIEELKDKEVEEELIEGELLKLSKEPTEENWKFEPLFCDSVGGSVLVWQIGFDGENKRLVIRYGKYKTTKGKRGKIQEQYHPIVINKSGRSLHEQAILEARNRYLLQYRKGYKPAGMEQSMELSGCKPMLANKYKLPDEKGKRSNVTKFPVGTMPKLDGIRALMKRTGNLIVARSRSNNVFNKFEHIKEQLMDFFGYLPEYCELDGEIYCMDMTMPTLSSVVRTEKKRHKRHDEVKYYIFDIIEPNRECWLKRYEMLKTAYEQYIKDHQNIAPTFEIVSNEIANSFGEIMENYKKYFNQGYEGLMIRHCVGDNATEKEILKSKYKPGRSNNLLKYKEFTDEEAIIIGGKTGTGPEENAVIFFIRDIRGNELYVRPRGSMKQRCIWYEMIDELVEKETKLTIRYQELSEYGVPRFPVGITIRDYE